MPLPFAVPASWPDRERVSPDRLQAARSELERLAPQFTPRFVEEVCLPLSGWLAARATSQPFVAALGGPPGSGKSTLVRALQLLLSRLFELSCAGFSLDDVYYTKAERALLSRDVHPLLATRGVPGTHDLALAHELVDRLSEAGPDRVAWVPRFDKLADDRVPHEAWVRVAERPAIILLDGWFWGAAPADPASLDVPINEREAADDPDGRWRRYVNTQLGGPYQLLFRRAELHVKLEAPNLETILDWRVEQQLALRGLRGTHPDAATRAQITHFLRLFERVLRLPSTAEPDLVLTLDAHRELVRLSGAAVGL